MASYAANTSQGILRNYNEDWVSIILSISKGNTKCLFFAVYDGHGEGFCCDYLRDSLHDHIIDQPAFPDDPRKALIEGIKDAESSFL
jgi:serine/threonine protein phosphatase PrpC